MENFPTKIFPKGQSVEILTDFRAVFQWNKMVSSEYLTPYEKSIGTVHLFCKTAIPKFLYNDALTEILKFIQCGESVDEIEPAEEKTIDFEKDYSLLTNIKIKDLVMEVRNNMATLKFQSYEIFQTLMHHLHRHLFIEPQVIITI